MNKLIIIIAFIFLAQSNSFAQSNLNDYKYILVPTQYEFLKEVDQYQLNSLTKFLFNKYGYTAFLKNDDLPEDLVNNRCLALTVQANKLNAFLNTKLEIELKDCNDKVVATSKVGESRDKSFDKAYNISLRDAFETFQNLDYKYQPNEKITSKGNPTVFKTNVDEDKEIERLKEEIKTLKEEKTEPVKVAEMPVKIEEPMVEVVEKEIKPTKIVKKTDAPEEIKTKKTGTSNATEEVFYAQPIDNGFQIVDTTPKKVMILYYSGIKDVFIVKGKDAIVYKKGDIWMYSENDGTNPKAESLNIKF